MPTPVGYQNYEFKLQNTTNRSQIIVVYVTARGQTQAKQIVENQNRGFVTWSSRVLHD